MPIYKTKVKKNGLTKYRVVVNYTINGEHKQSERVAYGADAAKETEIKLRNECKSLAIASDSGMTVRALYNIYMETKKHEVRESTYDKSRRNLENHILPHMGDIRLSKLDMRKISEWKNKISEKKLSLRMNNNIYSEFRALLNYAVKFDYIVRNPLTQVGKFKDAYDIAPKSEKLNYYTAEEFKKYIAQARKNKLDAKENGFNVFFSIAFYMGMRKGEINALKWSDIEGNLMNIRRSVSQKQKGGDRITPPKNKSSYRIIEIPQPLKKILDEHKKLVKKSLPGFHEGLFVCGGTTPLRDSTIENRNTQYAKDAGLKHIRIHDFRHSHASLLINEGINIQEVARRLGHSNIKVTLDTYSHLYPREEERATRVLNKVY